MEISDSEGNYIIIVAFMSEVPKLDSNTLQDCEQYAPATVDAGAHSINLLNWRIFLFFPLSYRTIADKNIVYKRLLKSPMFSKSSLSFFFWFPFCSM